MKVRVGRSALGEAVAFVARALSQRPVIPMLSGILLDADASGMSLSCFDYEVSASARLDAEVAEPGMVLVPGRLLAEITRNLPDRPAEFSSYADFVKLNCGSAEFELVSLVAEDYPVLPQTPPAIGTVNGGALARAVGQVAPAASRDDAVPMLTAICLEVTGSVLTLAATDRYRLAVREVPFEPAVPGLSAAALVPARIMAETARMVDPAAPVVLAFGRAEGEGAQGRRGDASARPRPAEGLIGLEAGDRRLTARLVGGEFINYASRFPAAFDCHAEIPAGPLIAAVRRAALVAGRLDPVRLTFRADQVVIEAHSEGRARAAETVSAEFSGAKPVMSFSPHYLLDGLVAAASGQAGAATAAAPHPHEHDEGDEETGEGAVVGEGTEVPGRIRLEFTDPAKPALITAVGDGGLTDIPAYRYLVVPMRVQARG